MKTMYEGMFIFPKALNEDEVEEALTIVAEEIQKCGGTVESTTRLGKRSFARTMKKQDAGYYAVIGFELDGSEVSNLHARLKLNDKVFRAQIVHAPKLDDSHKEGHESIVKEEEVSS